jgi:hypothetical protein
MVDYKVQVNLTETPRIVADRVIRERAMRDQAADGMRLLSRAEEHARYARTPLAGVDLSSALRAVRTAMRQGVSRRTMLRATLMPPSVFLRWRASTVNLYTAAANAANRRRDALIRAISPRRLFAPRSTP